MKRPIVDIRIGNFQFNYVHTGTITQNWNNFTDTATITLPNRFRFKNKTIIVGQDNLFKRGDPVLIFIGYFPNLVERFRGFISKVKPDSPMIIECEDDMFLLKQVNLKPKAFSNPTIKDVIEYATASIEGLDISFDDETAKIGGFHIDNKGFINAVTVFEVLKKQFGYNIYFKQGTLNVRVLKSILSLDAPVHRFGMQQNVVSGSISLEYQRDDDVDMMIRFTSKQEDNSVKIFYGIKKNGEPVISTTPSFAGVTNSWNIPELSDDQIKRIMLDNIDKFIWEGYTGSFTAFLEPAVNISDKVEVIDSEHTERQGAYLIQSVEITFGVDGGRQIITPRNRITT